jgi:hypothetical protein
MWQVRRAQNGQLVCARRLYGHADEKPLSPGGMAYADRFR